MELIGFIAIYFLALILIMRPKYYTPPEFYDSRKETYSSIKQDKEIDEKRKKRKNS